MITKISEQEVFEYREIYYEYFKPALKRRLGMSLEEAEEVVRPGLEKYGWTYEKYRAFGTIDLLQRFSRTLSKHYLEDGKEPNVQIKVGDEDADLLRASNFPELKCPRRTEEGKWKRFFAIRAIRDERKKSHA